MDQNEKRRLYVLGVRVNMYRKLKGYSVEELAKRVDRSPALIYKLEAPSTPINISLKTLFRICDQLEVSPEKLFEGLDN